MRYYFEREVLAFRRGFFAEPLVSKLPDGFRLECELSFASQKESSFSPTLRQKQKRNA